MCVYVYILLITYMTFRNTNSEGKYLGIQHINVCVIE